MQETTFIFMREFEERKRERGLDENLFWKNITENIVAICCVHVTTWQAANASMEIIWQCLDWDFPKKYK
jgi:hypothetical protein